MEVLELRLEVPKHHCHGEGNEFAVERECVPGVYSPRAHEAAGVVRSIPSRRYQVHTIQGCDERARIGKEDESGGVAVGSGDAGWSSEAIHTSRVSCSFLRVVEVRGDAVSKQVVNVEARLAFIIQRVKSLSNERTTVRERMSDGGLRGKSRIGKHGNQMSGLRDRSSKLGPSIIS